MPITVDEIHERLVRGQKQLLADMLEYGIPLVYQDENGQMVREHPNGYIEVIHLPEYDSREGQ
jgi:hypothetical protein